MNLSTALLQSKTKNIYKNHEDYKYQHDSSILHSNIGARINKDYTQTIDRQHLHNHDTSIWNRAINLGV